MDSIIGKYQGDPLLSIITISMNCEQVIEKTILSVIGQSYSNIEYIIIDGGSTDGTIDIIKRYEDRISNWASEKDQGISDAMNKGIQIAKGKIIGIIHAGDWYEPDAFDRVINCYNNQPADIFYGDVRFYSSNSVFLVPSTDYSNLSLKMSIAHPGSFITKQAYDTYGKYDLNYRLSMDYELMLRMFKAGALFKKIPGIVANFSEDGISSKGWKKALSESLQIKDKYAKSKIEKLLNYIFYWWILIGDSFKKKKKL